MSLWNILFIVQGLRRIASSLSAELSEDAARVFAARGSGPRWALRQPAAVEGDACRGYVPICLNLGEIEGRGGRSGSACFYLLNSLWSGYVEWREL